MLKPSILLLILLPLTTIADQNLTALETNGIKEWSPKSFSGNTSYELTKYQDKTALKATSNSTASGLILEKQIDLLNTPFLSWRWLIKNKLPSSIDETEKSGDDYAARVYVVIDGGWQIWKTQSLSYVWSSTQQAGQVWDNAYAGENVKMIAIRGEESDVETWYSEKRNVFDDLVQYFGDLGSAEANEDAYRYIDVIAIMTDTDDSQSNAEAYYGDLIFSEE